MATGIWDKLRLIGLANIHAALDKVIDMNDPAVVDQQMRDLMNKRDVVDEAVTASIARIRGIDREMKEKTERVATLTNVLTHIASDGSKSAQEQLVAARPKMTEKQKLDAAVTKLVADRESEATTRSALEGAKHILDSQIQRLSSRLQELRDTEHQSAAKEEAAKAMKMAREILDKSTGSELDSALQRAEKRKDAADVALEREMGRLKESTSNAAGDTTEVDAAFAAFKSGLAPKTEAPAA